MKRRQHKHHFIVHDDAQPQWGRHVWCDLCGYAIVAQDALAKEIALGATADKEAEKRAEK